jgi:hypothetical protein
METLSLSPRLDPAALPGHAALRRAPSMMSVVAESLRPVLAASSTGVATNQSSDGFKPLDTYEVGDNDQVPVPPEPPRKAMVLAIIGDLMSSDDTPEASESPAMPSTDAAQSSDTPAPPPSGSPDAPRTATPARADTLATALRTLETGPANPTINIRS